LFPVGGHARQLRAAEHTALWVPLALSRGPRVVAAEQAGVIDRLTPASSAIARRLDCAADGA
jgi:hypothetical protein